MIISHKHKFIYVKPFKVAGTSIELMLLDLCGDEDVITVGPIDQKFYPVGPRNQGNFYNHMTPNRILKHLDRNIWDSYYKFSVVRNPWDAAVSYFWWRNKSLDNFGKSLIPNYLDNQRYYFDRSGKPILDFYITYENLQSDFDKLFDHFGFERKQLPVTRNKTRSDKAHYSTMFSDFTKNIVANRNRDLISHFNYSFKGDPIAPDTLSLLDKTHIKLKDSLRRRYYIFGRI